jgi:catechol 2,3-dioxygenase-like lactoylglutathione lyase family enzyme
MSSTDVSTDTPTPLPGTSEMWLEVVVVPVSDVERARAFYETTMGWRLDANLKGGGRWVVQFTPPGSLCSIWIGEGITSAAPGSSQGMILAVQDVVATRDALMAGGVDVSEVFHRDDTGQVPGPDPEGRSYSTFASFSDPDGNTWLLQEIRTRLPGR